jgi:DNA polymerase III, subunit gamma and tau
MTSYQVSSRRHRPNTFSEILGQDMVVSILKNSLRLNRSAHAYIFSGIRGTGKTTLARVFAKALNCQSPTENQEPCNQCAICKEISLGTSMDVMEIDGASHRGIEDIRQINETVLFVPSKSRYKIYIIDEVHMLTKEAFNSLLKTLEEPPAHVKFFLATTEIAKIPNTISSRCQKMLLKRIPEETIIDKLTTIAKLGKIEASREALLPIAKAAQGSLRDAESLYDYVVGLFPESFTPEDTAKALGILSDDMLYQIAEAITTQNYEQALSPVSDAMHMGVAPAHFLQDLTLLFRSLLLKQHSQKFDSIAVKYSSESLLEILDFLGESARHVNLALFEKTFLETVIVRLLRIYSRPTLSQLVSQIKQPAQSPLRPIPSSSVLDPGPSPTKSIVKEEVKALPQPVEAKFSQGSLLTPPPSQPKKETLNQEVSAPSSSTPSCSEAAAIDTLLQFAVVEFSGVLTKEPKHG